MSKLLTFMKKPFVMIPVSAFLVVTIVITCILAFSAKAENKENIVFNNDGAALSANVENSTDAKTAAPTAKTETVSAPSPSIAEEQPEEPTEHTDSVPADVTPVPAESKTTNEPTVSVDTSEEPIDNEFMSGEADPSTFDWLIGYVPIQPEPIELDDDLKAEIQAAYAEWINLCRNEKSRAEDVEIEQFSGIYNGCVVARITDIANEVFPSVMCETEIGEVSFIYSCGYLMQAYKDGEFCSLKDAYERGWLSGTDIKDIGYYYYKTAFNGNYFPKS